MREHESTLPVLTPSSRLALGGFLGLSEGVPAAEPVDELAARTYAHPLLPDRKLVRLESISLAAGADAEMEILGCEPPTVSPPLARLRRRAAGFPAQALVLDPARARYALDVMKDFRLAARLARTRPAFARDAFNQLAVRLGASVPHFLPSYWEEAGRTFLELGNTSFAAVAFERARQSEKEYALKVEESHRAEAFLEFALGGALSVKSLSAYAKSLESHPDPKEALQQFVTLIVRRTRGGLPPYSGMAADLKRLLKGAGADPTTEGDALVESLLEASSIGRAPAEFWNTWRPNLIRLAKRKPEVRGRLLNLLPTPPSRPDDFASTWLTLLREAGALTSLLSPDGRCENGTEPKPHAAAWFQAFLLWADDEQHLLYPLLESMAPRLKHDAHPLKLWEDDGWRDSPPVNLLDLALSLGVPVANPTDECSLDLLEWAKTVGGEPPIPPRNPVHVAADERYRPHLDEAVGRASGNEDFEAAARGQSALMEARERWLLAQVASCDKEGLFALSDALDTLESRTQASMFGEFPQALEALNAVQPVMPLWRSLKAGLFDELHWPLLDSTMERLSEGGQEVHLRGIFPHLILHNGLRAVVLGPEGVTLEHDLALGKGPNSKGNQLQALFYAGGQLLVVMRTPEYSRKAYWSGQPDQLFDYTTGWYSRPAVSLTTADGGVFWGKRVFHPGEQVSPEAEDFVTDGTSAWRVDTDANPPAFVRLDVQTGQVIGKRSGNAREEASAGSTAEIPEPFKFGAMPEGYALEASACQLQLLTGAFVPSPLGGIPSQTQAHAGSHDVNGDKRHIYAWRVLADRRELLDDEEDVAPPEYLPRILETNDGRRWQGEIKGSKVPDALLTFPGTTELMPLISESNWRHEQETCNLYDPTGSYICHHMDWEEASTRYRTLPLAFWHALRPTDPAGSARLRRLTQDDSEKILALTQGFAQETASDETTLTPEAREEQTAQQLKALGELLPELSPALLKAVLRESLRAATLAISLEKLKIARDPSQQTTPVLEAGEATLDDRAALAALRGLQQGRYVSGNISRALVWHGAAFSGQMTLAQALAQAGERETDLSWWEWLGRARSLAYMLMAPGGNAEQQKSGKELLKRYADSPFAAGALPLRRYSVTLETDDHPLLRWEDRDEEELKELWWVEGADGQRLLVIPESTYGSAPHELTIYEVGVEKPSENGVLEVHWSTPERTAPADVIVFPRVDERAWLQQFLSFTESVGIQPWPLERIQRTASILASQLNISESEAILIVAGLPGMSRYEHDFLGKEMREALGLKLKEASAAKEALQRIKSETLCRVFAGTCANDPRALFLENWDQFDEETHHEVLKSLTEGMQLPAPSSEAELPMLKQCWDLFAHRIVQSWIAVQGRKVPIPVEILQRVGDELSLNNDSRELLEAILDPQQRSYFDRDGVFTFDPRMGVERPRSEQAGAGQAGGEQPAAEQVQDKGEVFDETYLSDAILLILWGSEQLPVGSPMRLALAQLGQKISQRLLNPNLIFPLGNVYFEPRQKRRFEALVDGLGGEAIEGRRREDEPKKKPASGRDNGILLGGCDEDDVNFALRPAVLAQKLAQVQAASGTGAGHATAEAQAARVWEPILRLNKVLEEEGEETPVQLLQAWFGIDFQAGLMRLTQTPVPEGRYESDPRVSAPAVVTKAAQTLGITEEAAALYLMLLTLRAPTDKRLQSLLDLKPARYKQLVATLLEKNLVLEAKRARAGRDVFLPGGWINIKSGVDLPLESWKLPLYQVTLDKEGTLHKPLGQILPMAPLHVLFERAWSRVEKGDGPRFQEELLKAKGKRGA